MEHTITYVGLDVHKSTIAVAIAETAGGVRSVSTAHFLANTPTALRGLVSRLTRSGAALQFCYEAGPCGYRYPAAANSGRPWMRRRRSFADPRKPGDRIKTDRRMDLAKLHRAGGTDPSLGSSIRLAPAASSRGRNRIADRILGG